MRIKQAVPNPDVGCPITIALPFKTIVLKNITAAAITTTTLATWSTVNWQTAKYRTTFTTCMTNWLKPKSSKWRHEKDLALHLRCLGQKDRQRPSEQLRKLFKKLNNYNLLKEPFKGKKISHHYSLVMAYFKVTGTPTGNRTPVTAVKGRCPNR